MENMLKLMVVSVALLVVICDGLNILSEMKNERDNSLTKLMKQAKVYTCMIADMGTIRKESTLSCVGELLPPIMENVTKDCFGEDNVTMSILQRAEYFCEATQYSAQEVLEKATCLTKRLTSMQFNELSLAASNDQNFNIKTFLDDVNQCYTKLQKEQNFTD